MKYTSILIALLFLVFSLSIGDARLLQLWNYSDLVKESTLIIIATHEKSSDDVDEKAPHAGGPSIVGVNSAFKVLSVLKGKAEDEKVIIHHYRYDKSVEGVRNGYRFISFPEGDKNTYLIFLKEDESKNIVPVAGQHDSVDSFKIINNAKEST